MKDIVDFVKGFDLHNIILIGAAFWWMNSNMNEQFNELDKRLTILEKDVSTIKTVLVMKQIMPNEMVKCKEANEKR